MTCGLIEDRGRQLASFPLTQARSLGKREPVRSLADVRRRVAPSPPRETWRAETSRKPEASAANNGARALPPLPEGEGLGEGEGSARITMVAPRADKPNLQPPNSGSNPWSQQQPEMRTLSVGHMLVIGPSIQSHFRYFSSGGFSNSLISGFSAFSGVTSTTPVSMRFSTFLPWRCSTMVITPL